MNKLLNKYSGFVLAVAPALAMYIILPGTNLSGLLLIISTIMVLLNYRGMYFNKIAKCLFVGVVALSIISYISNFSNVWFDQTVFVHNLWSIVLCLIPLVFVTNLINVETYIKTVFFIAIIASIVCLYQRLLLTVTGTFPSDFYLPLPMTDDVSTVTLRPHSFFREPAHLSLYLLPALYLALINGKKYYAALFMIGILSSGSTTGFLLGAAIFVIWLSSSRMKKGKLLISIAILLIVLSITIQFTPDLISSNTEKLINTDTNSSLRLLGSIEIIEKMSGRELLFGIGINQLANYGLYMTGYELANYANSVVYMLISYGIVGLFSMLLFVALLARKYDSNRGFLLILIGILFSDQILFNTHLLYLLSFILLSDKLIIKSK